MRKRAVLEAIGISTEGRRCVLGVELANRESPTSWREFLIGLEKRGLTGVEFVVSDAHESLVSAITQTLPEAVWQRCHVHFLRNAADHLPRRQDDDCITELRWIYDRRSLKEARTDLSAWLLKWQLKYPRLCTWAGQAIEETHSFFRLPHEHRKHMRSTNLLERVDEETSGGAPTNVRHPDHRRP